MTEFVEANASVGTLVCATPFVSARAPPVAVIFTTRSAGQEVEVPLVTKILYTLGLFDRVGVTTQLAVVVAPYTEWSLETGHAADTAVD